MDNAQSTARQIKSNAPTWDELINLEWELTDSGEIITANPAHIPYIKGLLGCRHNTENLRELCSELGGTLIEEATLNSPGAIHLDWEISPDGEIITDQPEYIPFIRTYLKNKAESEAFYQQFKDEK